METIDTSSSRLQQFADSAFVKLIHYGITVVLVPLMFNIQSALLQIQVSQAITTNEVANFKELKLQRDAELTEVHHSMGEMQARLAATEAMVGALVRSNNIGK